ncbi:hypothetical protein L3V83_06525 [Thiotrichales bacterium 19X7-9]|nr:hypothetical protein [Thiotrichales bacterium 19X7-9]
MPILLNQDKYTICNLSKVPDNDYISTYNVSMGCASFSVIGISKNNETIALIGHAGGGYVNNQQLTQFESVIQEHGIRQLNILDITLSEFKDNHRILETNRNKNVIEWTDRLYQNGTIDGFKINSMTSERVDSVKYGNQGIYTNAQEFLPQPIAEIPEITKGNTDQIDHINTPSVIRPPSQHNTPKTPLLENSLSDKSSEDCRCTLI